MFGMFLEKNILFLPKYTLQLRYTSTLFIIVTIYQ